MTSGGWWMLGVSWLAIASLAAYCMVRTLREGGLERDAEEPGDDAPPHP